MRSTVFTALLFLCNPRSCPEQLVLNIFHATITLRYFNSLNVLTTLATDVTAVLCAGTESADVEQACLPSEVILRICCDTGRENSLGTHDWLIRHPPLPPRKYYVR
ncbi:hypothetical protein F5882DRAFT_396916 [Hyaloscypha sp. PMI_1271]|nr:hypothetical protein F5882DRAFT_396916 [Hyaloscypha sp. PMI_1271]